MIALAAIAREASLRESFNRLMNRARVRCVMEMTTKPVRPQRIRSRADISQPIAGAVGQCVRGCSMCTQIDYECIMCIMYNDVQTTRYHFRIAYVCVALYHGSTVL